jgi:2'-5' RNA ligase
MSEAIVLPPFLVNYLRKNLFKYVLFFRDMRAFIAIDLDEKAKEQIKKIVKQLKKQDFFKGKYVEEENFHLTLKFLGEISNEKVEKIKDELNKLDFGEFKVKLRRLGVFSPKFIKVVWISLESAKLQEIHDKIDDSLEELFNKDKRFNSHITIARVKAMRKDKKIELLDFIKKLEVPDIEFEVNEVKLKKSTLTPKGPIYEDIFVKELN